MEPGLGLIQGDAGRQPADRSEVVPLVFRVRVELERNPDFWVSYQILNVEVAQHADYFVGIAAQGNGPADDVGIPIEAATPQLIAEHSDAVPAWTILFGAERAAKQDGRPEQTEEISRDLSRSELLGKRAAGVVHQPAAERRHVADDLGLRAPVLKLRG